MVALIPWKAQQSNIENEEENRGSLEKRSDSKENEKFCYLSSWSDIIPNIYALTVSVYCGME